MRPETCSPLHDALLGVIAFGSGGLTFTRWTTGSGGQSTCERAASDGRRRRQSTEALCRRFVACYLIPAFQAATIAVGTLLVTAFLEEFHTPTICTPPGISATCEA